MLGVADWRFDASVSLLPSCRCIDLCSIRDEPIDIRLVLRFRLNIIWTMAFSFKSRLAFCHPLRHLLGRLPTRITLLMRATLRAVRTVLPLARRTGSGAPIPKIFELVGRNLEALTLMPLPARREEADGGGREADVSI